MQFTLTHGPNIPHSYAILLITASSFTFTTRHVHLGPVALFCLELLIVAVHSSPVAYWTPSDLGWVGGSSCGVISFSLFILFMRFSKQEYWSALPFLSPADHVLSELFTMPHQSWVVLQSMANSFIELREPLCHDKAVTHEEVMTLYWLINYWLCKYLVRSLVS